MIESTRYAGLVLILSACAGPAGGQGVPADPGQLGRATMYEIPNEQVNAMTQESPDPGWIQVNGTGSVDVSPDRARVVFAMETRAAAADDAAGTNADAMAAVFSALRGDGLPGLQLETFGYSLRPEYANTGSGQGTREIVAYVAMNNVSATIDDVDAVGRLVDTAIGAGANRVSSISFFASDTEEARTEALAQAVAQARAEAEVIARSLGYRLGPPLEINGGADRPMPRPYEAVAMAQARADTPIEAGSQTVTANVSIRFALGPESGG